MPSPLTRSAASVTYRAAILDAATGVEVATLPRKKNLILDSGLDMVAVHRWTDCITYAAAGSGTTATRRDSGAVTVSRSGSTLTASAGWFVAGDVGRLFKFASGEEVRISAYSSATSVTTTTSGTIAAAPGTMWSVNQTALAAEIVRTNNYGTGGGDNSVSLNAATGILTQKRTFVFPAETGTVTYREVGWSPNFASGSALFGRDVLAGSGLTLVAGQQLKIVLELAITLELLTPGDANAAAWTTGTATQQFENIYYGGTWDPSAVASGGVRAFVGTSTAAFIAPRLTDSEPGGPLDGTIFDVAVTAAPYVAGSFQRDFSGFFDLNAGNSSALRCAGFGFQGYYTFYPILRVRYAANQVKNSDHSLTLPFRHTWGRVLTN